MHYYYYCYCRYRVVQFMVYRLYNGTLECEVKTPLPLPTGSLSRAISDRH